MAEERIDQIKDEPAQEVSAVATAAAEVTVSPRRTVRRAFRAETVFAIGLGLFAVLAVLAYRNAYFGWDLRVATYIQSITAAGFRELMIWVSVLGNGFVPVVSVGITGLLLIFLRFRIEGSVCIFGVSMGGLMNRLLKALIARPRPDADLVQVLFEVRHESFPSGHVTYFVEYFGFLFFLAYVLLRRGRLRKVALAVIAVPILLIGVSRVYLGAHWPSDVLGAYLAGGMWLIFMIEVYRRLKSSAV